MDAPSFERVARRGALAWPSESKGEPRLPGRKRPDRLRGRAQFDAVLARPAGIARGRYFIVRVSRGAGTGARLGIVAARKAIRRAVDRNTSKRMVREAFREHTSELAGVDIVVVCRAAVPRRSRREARQELDRMLPQLAQASRPR